MARDSSKDGDAADEKKPQYGCELAPKIPPGVNITDVRQQKWTIGEHQGFINRFSL